MSPESAAAVRRVAACFLALGAVACAGERRVVDGGGGDGGDVIDADGDGHASTETGGDDCNDSDPTIHPGIVEDEGWVVEVVDAIVGCSNLTIEMAGEQPAIACTDEVGFRLAIRSAEGWRDESVDVASPVARFGLAMEDDGDAHLAFTPVGPENAVWYTTNAGGGWSVATEVAAGYVLVSDSIAVDAAGRVVVGFRDLDGYPAVAVRDGPEWQVESVPFDNTCGLVDAMRAGPDLAVHFVWMTECVDFMLDHDGVPVHLTNATGSWTSEPITSDEFGWASVALSPSGDPAVALASRDEDAYPQRDIHEAEESDGRWDTESVGAGLFPSIAIDRLGVRHIVTGNTHYFRVEGAPWQSEPFTDSWVPPYATRIAASMEGIHVAFASPDSQAAYAYSSLRDGVDNDCDGIAW
jgi:hypothetical protein